jgi:hypothetical protein
MPKRFCGELDISVRLHDFRYAYVVTISKNRKRLCVQTVKWPNVGPWSGTMETPEAFDKAADAALSLAADEGHLDGSSIEFKDGGSEYLIRRHREQQDKEDHRQGGP